MSKLIHSQGNFLHILAFAVTLFSLSACAGFPASGPTTGNIETPGDDKLANIKVVDVDNSLIQKIAQTRKSQSFAETFTAGRPEEYRIGHGDVLEITVWEAPPATLFVTTMDQSEFSIGMAKLPEQIVRNDGTISIPFSGPVPAAGFTASEVENDIVNRLQKKANQPQVLVRVLHNASSNVKLLGEFENNAMVPLTSKGEKLLDAVAAARGVRLPVRKMTLQLARGNTIRAMPMEKVLEDPAQNVYLQPDDVITALSAPLSITVLGAVAKNEEQNFETSGISLAQALGRAGGLLDVRADAKGVFVFRYERDEGAEAKPVIYHLNLKSPASLFLAQGFEMRDKDVLFVSTAPSTDLYKFLDLLGAATRAVAPPVSWSRWW